MSKMYDEIISIISKRNLSETEKNQICERISNNSFTNKEYHKFISNISDCDLVKKIISILPLKVLLELSLYDDSTFQFDFEYDEIFKRFKNFNKSKINTLLNVYNEQIRARAIEIADLNEVINLALKEENEVVLDEVIDRFDYEHPMSTSDYDKLLYAKSNFIVTYAIEYVSLESLLSFLQSERVLNIDYHVEMALYVKVSNSQYTKEDLEVLLNSNVSEIIYAISEQLEEEDYNKLLNSSNELIRAFSVKYASIENILKLALIEEDYQVITNIISRIKEANISQDQIDSLIKAVSNNIKCYCIPFISIEALMNMALFEEKDDLVYTMIHRIETPMLLNQYHFDKLLNAVLPDIRRIALEKATFDAKVNLAVNEENQEILRILLDFLEKCDSLSINQYNALLNSNSIDIRKYAFKNADIEAILSLALKEEDIYFCRDIASKINANIEKISDRSLINKLLYAKSNYIKSFAIDIVDIADIDELEKFIKIEEDKELLELADKRIKTHQIIETLML